MDITGKAIKLESGGTYIIESESELSDSQLAALASQGKVLFDRTGITLIYLSGGLKIAREAVPFYCEVEV